MNKDKIQFVEEVEENLINAIRKYVSEVPVLAVDNVDISRNDSAVYDETIAHRLGLIPLKMGKTKQKEVQISLSSKKEGIVYSGELQGNISPVFDGMPIAILQKGQELELVANVALGRGSEHSKFTPGMIYYRNLKQIKTGSKAKEIADAYARTGGKESINFENNKTYDLDVSDLFEFELENIGVEVMPTKKQIVFIETFGQLDVEEIIPSAVKELKDDLATVSKEVSSSK